MKNSVRFSGRKNWMDDKKESARQTGIDSYFFYYCNKSKLIKLKKSLFIFGLSIISCFIASCSIDNSSEPDKEKAEKNLISYFEIKSTSDSLIFDSISIQDISKLSDADILKMKIETEEFNIEQLNNSIEMKDKFMKDISSDFDNLIDPNFSDDLKTKRSNRINRKLKYQHKLKTADKTNIAGYKLSGNIYTCIRGKHMVDKIEISTDINFNPIEPEYVDLSTNYDQ